MSLAPASTALMSWGVMNRYCLSLLFGSLANSIKASMEILRFTASMKTSNSSIALNGLSTFSPSANVSASVAYERSPPDIDLVSFTVCPAPFIFTSRLSSARLKSTLTWPACPFLAMW